MNNKEQHSWLQLKQAGLVAGEVPPPGEVESPWYVKAISAASGWLAALFLLGFIGLAFEFVIDNHDAAFIVGLIMIAIAYSVLRLPQKEFVEHLALAASLAGQALVVYAIFSMVDRYEALTWGLVAVFELALTWLMPNFIHRLFSAFITAFAFAQCTKDLGIAFVYSGILLFSVTWLWLNEFRFPQYMKVIRPVGYGLVLAMVQVKGSAIAKGGGWVFWVAGAKSGDFAWEAFWSEVMIGLATLYLVWCLLQRAGYQISDRPSLVILASTVVISLISAEAQGITVGIVILMLGFSGSNRLLMGLGVVSLLFYISFYYYWLEQTLLLKSQTLLALGLVLLAVRWVLLRTLVPAGQEVKSSE